MDINQQREMIMDILEDAEYHLWFYERDRKAHLVKRIGTDATVICINGRILGDQILEMPWSKHDGKTFRSVTDKDMCHRCLSIIKENDLIPVNYVHTFDDYKSEEKKHLIDYDKS